jgi:D-mannonate dehydratase
MSYTQYNEPYTRQHMISFLHFHAMLDKEQCDFHRSSHSHGNSEMCRQNMSSEFNNKMTTILQKTTETIWL